MAKVPDDYNWVYEYEKARQVAAGWRVEPWEQNPYKGLVWDKPVEITVDPIELWVERWIDELGTIK